MFLFIATLLGTHAVDHVTVNKFEAVSLYGGTADNEGLVVVRDTKSATPDFQFKGVCTMTAADATVACKMMGYSGGQIKTGNAFGSRYVPLHEAYSCTGTENSLYECPGYQTVLAPGALCTATDAIGVVCGAAECQAGDGTNGYVNLDSDRLTSKTGGPFMCDVTTAPSWASKSSDWQGNNKWYRFVGGSGQLARSVPSTGRCHTNVGAFSPSSLPATGLTKPIVVCYGKANSCLPNKEAMVTNCGSFYVYQLPDVPYCSVRYCAV